MTLTALESDPEDADDYTPVPTNPESDKTPLLDDKSGKDEEDVPPRPYELQDCRTQRITSSFRGTIGHLRKEDGIMFPFRGFFTAVWYGLATTLMGDFLGACIAPLFGADVSKLDMDKIDFTTGPAMIIGQGLAVVVLINMATVALHAQIASRASINAHGVGFQRVLQASWKNTLPTFLPTLIIALATAYSQITLESYSQYIKVHKVAEGKFSGCTFAAFVVLSLLSLFSYLSLIRIQASSFPREDKTVIPMKFGFGMIPESNEVKALSFCKASRSFKRADIVHLVKMGIKVFIVSAISHFLLIVAVGIAFVATMAVAGPSLLYGRGH